MWVGVPGTGSGEPNGSYARHAYNGRSHAADTKNARSGDSVSVCTLQDSNPESLNLQRLRNGVPVAVGVSPLFGASHRRSGAMAWSGLLGIVRSSLWLALGSSVCCRFERTQYVTAHQILPIYARNLVGLIFVHSLFGILQIIMRVPARFPGLRPAFPSMRDLWAS